MNLFLALRAEVGAAAQEFDFGNWGAAIFTRFPGPAINFKIGDEAAGPAVAPDIIARARAALPDGQFQNSLDRSM